MSVNMNEVIRRAKAFQRMHPPKIKAPDDRKITRLNFDYNRITPRKTNAQFGLFETVVDEAVQNNERINKSNFYGQIIHFVDAYLERGNIESLNNRLTNLAEKFVRTGNDNFAGIIYSILIKVNRSYYLPNPNRLEKQILSGIAIAKRTHDPIHLMARYRDLDRLYNSYPTNLDKKLKVLGKVEHALTKICNNYNSVDKRYNSISREIKPRRNYQLLLGETKVRIAKFIKDTNPTEARKKLESAYDTVIELGEGALIKDIRKQLKELNP